MSDTFFHSAAVAADLLISNVHVCDPREGIDSLQDVVVEGGVITGIHEPGSGSTSGRVIAGDGLHLFPAFVDPHIHLRSPGQEYKEDIASGTMAAAAGGYCAVVAMPNTDPVVSDASILTALIEQAKEDAVIPTGFMASITRDLKGEALTEMADLRNSGAVGFTDDGKPVSSAGMLRQALRYQKLAGGLIALHEEDQTLSAGGSMHEGQVSARLGVTGIPSISESTLIARDAAIALYEGVPVHFQHLSAVESVAALHAAKEQGAPVTAEVTPHHLTLTQDDLYTLDTNLKMNPPLRAESDRTELIAALKSGLIDLIATDHAPHALHEKEVPFEQAAMGTTGLETAFAALYTELVLPGVIDLDLLIERLSAGAKICDLQVPLIAVGEVANVCLVNLNEQWQVGLNGYHSKSANSCYDGRTLQGAIKLTLAAGQVAFDQLSGEEG